MNKSVFGPGGCSENEGFCSLQNYGVNALTGRVGRSLWGAEGSSGAAIQGAGSLGEESRGPLRALYKLVFFKHLVFTQ